jgi:hypothetical protein
VPFRDRQALSTVGMGGTQRHEAAVALLYAVQAVDNLLDRPDVFFLDTRGVHSILSALHVGSPVGAAQLACYDSTCLQQEPL